MLIQFVKKIALLLYKNSPKSIILGKVFYFIFLLLLFFLRISKEILITTISQECDFLVGVFILLHMILDGVKWFK